jgi:hypothetical protein
MTKKKKQYGEGVYDWVANNVFGANLKDGEIHAPQYTKDGFRFGKFIGPGTDVYGRLRKNIKPVSKTDETAKLHDIMFSLAETPNDVRTADLRMIRNLNRIQKNKEDYKFNIYMGKLPIKAKMKLEDWGVIKKGSFSGMKGALIEKKDRELLEKEKKKLIQKGYGKKSAWITHVKEYQKKHGCSYKEALQKSKVSYKRS